MAKPTKPEEKEKHGFIENVKEALHIGEHKAETEETDVPDSKPSKKVSSDAGAAVDMSAHPKFAKFKKGN